MEINKGSTDGALILGLLTNVLEKVVWDREFNFLGHSPENFSFLDGQIEFCPGGAIHKGKRGVTADTDLRLCHFFDLSAGYWLRAQAAHDIEVAQVQLGKTLQTIKPWAHHVA